MLTCRICGGHRFLRAARLGDEGPMAGLLAYQQVGWNQRPGWHTLYTCADCAVERADDAARDQELASLLFAARDLAENQFTRVRRNGRRVTVCVECGCARLGATASYHAEICRTGRVLRLLAKLMDAGRAAMDRTSNDLDCGAADSLATADAPARNGGAR